MLLLYVPLARIREAWISFLALQLISWGLGALITNFEWKVCPVRMFPSATRLNFVADFFFYPAVFILYYLYFPKSNRNIQILYALAYSVGIGLWNYFMVLFTDLEKYRYWNGFIHSMVAFVAFLTCFGFTRWFFKHPYPQKEEEQL
jgi:hypothetical protein